MLYPAMLFFICIGVYAINFQVFDIFVVLLFGVVGFVMTKFGYPPAPILLGFVLGPMMEEHFARALLMSRGSFTIFWERPISAVLLVATLILLAFSLRSAVKAMLAGRREVMEASREL
jgi:putative tricarboxylic transport membrane protein